jgi:hypothetical protein
MNKLKLLEHTFNKLTADKSFVAYYLEQLAITENKSQNEIIQLLNCSKENYFKLGLCKVPEINAADYVSRITIIARYATVSEVILSNIISPITTDVKPDKLIQAWKNFERLITLPNWFIRSQGKIYKTAFSVCILLLLLVSYTPKDRETKNLQVFIGMHYSYTNTKKHIELQDNTYVCIINLKKYHKPVEHFI